MEKHDEGMMRNINNLFGHGETITLEYRNSSNGYYGGSLVRVEN